jgi:hypothetical protein
MRGFLNRDLRTLPAEDVAVLNDAGDPSDSFDLPPGAHQPMTLQVTFPKGLPEGVEYIGIFVVYAMTVWAVWDIKW